MKEPTLRFFGTQRLISVLVTLITVEPGIREIFGVQTVRKAVVFVANHAVPLREPPAKTRKLRKQKG